MAEIIIYSKKLCPYCNAAKELFKAKGVEYTEFDIEEDPKYREEAVEKSGGLMTVPQIFIDGKHIGGFDDMKALDDEGGLDPLLN